MEEKKCSDCVFFKPHYERSGHSMLIGFCNWPSEEGDPVALPAIAMDRVITWEDEERDCPHWKGKEIRGEGIHELINDFLSYYLSLKKTGEEIEKRLSELLRPLIPDIECKLVSDIAFNLQSLTQKQEDSNLIDWDELCAYRTKGFPLGEFLSGFYGTGIFESRISLTWEELKELIKILDRGEK